VFYFKEVSLFGSILLKNRRGELKTIGINESVSTNVEAPLSLTYDAL